MTNQGSHNNIQDIVCAICIEPVVSDDKVIYMPNCKHKFHTQCFLSLMCHSAQSQCRDVVCPECRSAVVQLPLYEPQHMLPQSTPPHTMVIEMPEVPREYQERERKVLGNWLITTASALSILWLVYLSQNTPAT